MGARKPPMMAGFQAEENLTGRASKKMCEKLWTLSKIFPLANVFLKNHAAWTAIQNIKITPRAPICIVILDGMSLFHKYKLFFSQLPTPFLLGRLEKIKRRTECSVITPYAWKENFVGWSKRGFPALRDEKYCPSLQHGYGR